MADCTPGGYDAHYKLGLTPFVWWRVTQLTETDGCINTCSCWMSSCYVWPRKVRHYCQLFRLKVYFYRRKIIRFRGAWVSWAEAYHRTSWRWNITVLHRPGCARARRRHVIYVSTTTPLSMTAVCGAVCGALLWKGQRIVIINWVTDPTTEVDSSLRCSGSDAGYRSVDCNIITAADNDRSWFIELLFTSETQQLHGLVSNSTTRTNRPNVVQHHPRTDANNPTTCCTTCLCVRSCSGVWH